jgi:hypothetical protein
LTAEVEGQILGYIRAGGFPEVAAEAAGVARETFALWMRRGEQPRSRYRKFALAVRQAAAQARLKAEIEIREQQPRTWLLHGPGRDRGGLVGWSAMARSDMGTRDPDNELMMAGAMNRLLQNVMAALGDHPEVRALVAERISAKF